MRYVALAAVYDGTLARDGRRDERCVEALRALAATGRKLILVTHRELRDLLEIFPEARLFDYLVAECGAVMHRPATRQSAILAQAPSEILVQELRRRHIAPLSVGSSIVTTNRVNEAEVRDVVAKLRIDVQIVVNGSAVSILPAGVDEASGMCAALRELGLSAHNLVAIGSTDNDAALLALAEYSAAVQNADPGLKRCADRTMQGEHCDGFIEVVQELTANDLTGWPGRRKLVLGVRPDRVEASIEPCRNTVLVCSADSGRSTFCTGLLQQLLRQEYQCCIVGTDVNSADVLSPGIAVFGDTQEIPRLTDVLDALEQPTISVAIHLAALSVKNRPVFMDALLLQLQALHDRTGRPHAILIDQAHCFFFGSSGARPVPRLTDVTVIYSSSEPAQMPRHMLSSVQVIVARDADELQQLHALTGHVLPAATSLSLLRGQALLWMHQCEATPIQPRDPSISDWQAPPPEAAING